ncbi:MAG: hypothetical protein KF866_07255, partial [Phycisphaeraceae bacterium]|nr:hypothetical protein [Phycisphaeraceae bacterium]
TYDPQLGRFLQRDPNATGLLILREVALGGKSIGASVFRLDLATHIGDSVATSAYLGINPLTRSDPTGLWFGMAFQLGTMAVNGYLNAAGTLEEARQGLITTFSLSQMLADYSTAQMKDAEWADDWTFDDSEYSQAGKQAQDIYELQLKRGEVSEQDYAAASIYSYKGARSNLRGVSRNKYNARRAAFEKMRPTLWKLEAKRHPQPGGKYTKEQLDDMKAGKAPIGSDGQKMQIHHIRPLMHGGTNQRSNLAFVTASEHRKNYKEWHKYIDE